MSVPVRPVRIVFCWAEVSGYMAACWRALAAQPGVDLHIIHTERILNRPNPFEVAPLLEGLSHQMFDTSRPDVDRYLLEAVAERRPDVVVLCGWIYWPYTRLVRAPRLAGARMLLGMDSPWRATLVQRFARLRLSQFVGGLAMVITAGERSTEYARRIGVPEERLRTGYYGFEYERFAAAMDRTPAQWPRQFLFAGRYVPAKDLATLIRAYAAYRRRVSNPWSLTCAGQGPDGRLLHGVEGVTDIGFAQPAQLPELFAAHGAFVLPSRFEPWGVVLGEAAAAGLPVVCSSACGAALDLVRPYYSGIVVPPGDVDGLSAAMQWIHDHESELRGMGQRGQALAAAFSAQAWAVRWHNYALEAVGRGDEVHPTEAK
jgi:glycosyltransferase involved in cell wall biosynthesis